MKQLVFTLLIIFSSASLATEENPEIKENPEPEKVEYFCKMKLFQACQAQVSLCLGLINGTPNWEGGLECANDYKTCIIEGYPGCEQITPQLRENQ